VVVVCRGCCRSLLWSGVCCPKRRRQTTPSSFAV
jgi:hypothetical protein